MSSKIYVTPVDTNDAATKGYVDARFNLRKVHDNETRLIHEDYENVVTAMQIDGLLIIDGLLTIL